MNEPRTLDLIKPPKNAYSRTSVAKCELGYWGFWCPTCWTWFWFLSMALNTQEHAFDMSYKHAYRHPGVPVNGPTR